MFSFNCIGKKIKGVAKFVFIIITVLLIFEGVIQVLHDREGLAFILMFIGPLAAWISSMFVYGFGELIDKTCDIADSICNKDKE